MSRLPHRAAASAGGDEVLREKLRKSRESSSSLERSPRGTRPPLHHRPRTPPRTNVIRHLHACPRLTSVAVVLQRRATGGLSTGRCAAPTGWASACLLAHRGQIPHVPPQNRALRVSPTFARSFGSSKKLREKRIARRLFQRTPKN